MIEVTQNARDAAERLAIGNPYTCFDCKDELTFAFDALARATIAKVLDDMAEPSEGMLDAGAVRATPMLIPNTPGRVWQAMLAQYRKEMLG